MDNKMLAGQTSVMDDRRVTNLSDSVQQFSDIRCAADNQRPTMSDAQVEVDKLDRAEILDRQTGWRRLYYHPIAQVSLLGVVCFMCPGMFAALTGLGDGGQVDNTDQANASAAMYSTLAFFGFFSGYVKDVVCIMATNVVAVPLIMSLVLAGL